MDEEIDYIFCKICGERFLQLNHRHIKTHNLTTKEYKEKFNVEKLTSKEFIKNRENTFLKRFKAKNQFGRVEVREKLDKKQIYKNSLKAIKLKYGVDNISSLEWIKLKKEKTNLKNCGYNNNLKFPGVIEKSIATRKEKAFKSAISRLLPKNEKDLENLLKLEKKIYQRVRVEIRGALKGKNNLNKLGYRISDLEKHLKSSLPLGYTWEDFINKRTDLHIDHIIPRTLYKITSYECEDFKKCWNIRNLRLIPSIENISKNNKLDINLISKYKIEDLLPNNILIEK
jgi:hypothetical protein